MSTTRIRIKPLRGTARHVWQILHVTSAVGWLGILLSTLALCMTGLFADQATARPAYDAAELIAEVFFAPATLLMLVSGVVLGLGTKWGLFRFYWVVVKLGIGLLLVVAGTMTLGATIADTADLAAGPAVLEYGAKIGLVGMIAVLSLLTLVALVLSVVKPWGRINRRARTVRAPATQEAS